MNIPVRKFLCADSLVEAVHHKFKQIPDPRSLSRTDIPFIDVLMSGLAVFGLKFPSLLSYDEKRSIYADNLKALYRVNRAPSDTYKKIFAELQRGKCLEPADPAMI